MTMTAKRTTTKTTAFALAFAFVAAAAPQAQAQMPAVNMLPEKTRDAAKEAKQQEIDEAYQRSRGPAQAQAAPNDPWANMRGTEPAAAAPAKKKTAPKQ